MKEFGTVYLTLFAKHLHSLQKLFRYIEEYQAPEREDDDGVKTYQFAIIENIIEENKYECNKDEIEFLKFCSDNEISYIEF